MAIPLFFIGHWYLSLFSQTFFLHRYSAHRMFTLNKFWERFFWIFTYITQGASFLNPRGYAILHRLHHIHSDSAQDPHSPRHSTNIFTMMWRTKKMYEGYVNNKIHASNEVEANIPQWKGFEKFAESGFSRIAWGTLYVLFYIYFAGSDWWWYPLLLVHFIIGPVHGAIVNWFGHWLGYRNFKNNDDSRNTLPMDVLMMGELFQNNHHHHPLKINFAVKWFELDPTWQIMKLLNFLKIIKLKRSKEKTIQTPVNN